MTHIFGYAGPWTASLDPAALRAHAPANLDTAEIPSLEAVLAARDTARAGNVVAVVRGRPVWVRNGSYGSEPVSSASLLEVYRERGEALFGELRGRYSLAIIDGDRRRVFLAVDPMGIERMCWAATAQSLVFSDSAEAIANFPALRAPLRAQALHDFLLLHMIPSPDTAYEGVRKLEPGTTLVFEDGRARIVRHWIPQFSEDGNEPFDALKAGLHDALDAAVRRIGTNDQTGAFLSGGLDSSTVAGVLGRVAGKSARTFSIGFGVESHDEIRYARISARQFGCRSIEYNVTADDIVSAFERIAAAYDEPFGNSSAVPTLFCAQLAAKAGVTHLLAGDGGDELFGGNERYARQRVFEVYGKLPGWLRHAALEPLSNLAGEDNAIMPLRKLSSYVRQARVPLPERLETWNFFYRTPHAEIFEPDFSRNIDTRRPIEAMRAVYDSVSDASLLNRMMHYDWHYTLADNDLRKVLTMCELAGVEVSFPMLDPEVIDLSLRVPSGAKMQGNELRSFYKRAMTGFLPSEVINKQKHGFGLPFGVWLKNHAPLQDLIFSQLDRLGRRGIIRKPFLDRIIAEHREGEAGYYGYAIWDFAMLESWLGAHRPRGI